MKHTTYKYLFALILAGGLSSCRKNLLDSLPNDRVSANIFWKTENDALLADNALYTDLDGVSIFTWDALSDIAHTNQNFDTQAFIELGTYDIANAKIYNEWSAAYTGIQATNYFLENIDKVSSTNTTLINRFKGEAKVLRAYQYIKLAGFFGDVPLITKTLTIAEGQQVTRTPVSQVWDFVDKELSDAAALLPATYGAADKGRVTSGAAWALKARADLWARRYQLVVDAANQVKGYTLYSSYQNLFKYAAENNSEVILDKQFLKDTYSNGVFALLAPYSQKNAQSYYVPTKSLVDAYETADGKNINDAGSGFDPYHPYDNRDPRLRFSVFVDGDALPSGIAFKPAPNSGTADAIGSTYIASTTGYNIKKYINTEDYANPSNSGINIILLRYAEVLLTLAEAKIELNQIDQSVYDAINTVRNGRSDVKLPNIATGLTQEQLRQIVRHERTVELAFEGLHLFDIRRWKTAETVMTGPVYGITYSDATNKLVTVQVVSFNRVFDKSRHYLWPIPQKETNLNPNLKQNPNW
ncbi:RagB/SusD family nutrient uptake outer membrane protein [Mucilaginibacter sp. CAU 1740]|uniref:RagB/SusD family nutrient uptake outer membrane protein n=1 Tax=Mucilaginibacter sp. CAU 1740 TaxID=3140365 RepID=UPI00325B6DD3